MTSCKYYLGGLKMHGRYPGTVSVVGVLSSQAPVPDINSSYPFLKLSIVDASLRLFGRLFHGLITLRLKKFLLRLNHVSALTLSAPDMILKV